MYGSGDWRAAAAWRHAAANRAQHAEFARRDNTTMPPPGLQQPIGYRTPRAGGPSGGDMYLNPKGGARPGMAGRGRVFQAPDRQVDEAPCHPIGMSKTEADAETLLAQVEDQAAKRHRVDDALVAAQMAPLLQSVETELSQVQQHLAREQHLNRALLNKMDQLRDGIERTSREHRMKVAQLQRGDPETQRKLEKYRSKLEKGEHHARHLEMVDTERRSKALKKGVEQCDDGDIRLLASKQSELTPTEARRFLGVTAGDGDTAPAAAAKRLMAKMHPDRVHIDACKEGLRMRFQLVQHARDVLNPPDKG